MTLQILKHYLFYLKGVEVAPLEKEVEELERQIANHRTICVELQENWLKLQDDLVNLTTRRDEILAENDLIRKGEILINKFIFFTVLCELFTLRYL